MLLERKKTLKDKLREQHNERKGGVVKKIISKIIKPKK